MVRGRAVARPAEFVAYPSDAQALPVSTATAQPAGQSAYYQLFYRNAAVNFCNATTANLSNGVQLLWR